MKYKITYLNQWGMRRTKTIKAESVEEANNKAVEYVNSTEYEYMKGIGNSEIISVVEQDGGAE